MGLCLFQAPVMRIVVLSSDIPFVEGGHRKIARSVHHALSQAGVETELRFTPQNPFAGFVASYFSHMLMDFREDGQGRKVDGVLSLRFPTYCVRANKTVIWLTHRIREYYDLWDEFYSRLNLKGKIAERVRRGIVRFLDKRYMKRASKIFTISREVASRLKKWGNLEAEVLYPPPPPRPYRCGEAGDYFFFPSRLARLKRQEVAIRALKLVPKAKLIIAGEGEKRKELEALAEEIGVKDRVLFTGYLNGEELAEYYSKALAVIFIPYKEDYGFVTSEAFFSCKPVITFQDSGGAKELVRDGENGLVLPPSEEALAEAMDYFLTHRERAKEMGQEGAKIKQWLSWERVAERIKESFGEIGSG